MNQSRAFPRVCGAEIRTEHKRSLGLGKSSFEIAAQE
jgi:hypothetical protein